MQKAVSSNSLKAETFYKGNFYNNLVKVSWFQEGFGTFDALLQFTHELQDALDECF